MSSPPTHIFRCMSCKRWFKTRESWEKEIPLEEVVALKLSDSVPVLSAEAEMCNTCVIHAVHEAERKKYYR